MNTPDTVPAPHPGQTTYDDRRAVLIAALQAAGEILSRPGEEVEDDARRQERKNARKDAQRLGAELESLCEEEIAKVAGDNPDARRVQRGAYAGIGLPPAVQPAPRRRYELTPDSPPQARGRAAKERAE